MIPRPGSPGVFGFVGGFPRAHNLLVARPGASTQSGELENRLAGPCVRHQSDPRQSTAHIFCAFLCLGVGRKVATAPLLRRTEEAPAWDEAPASCLVGFEDGCSSSMFRPRRRRGTTWPERLEHGFDQPTGTVFALNTLGVGPGPGGLLSVLDGATGRPVPWIPSTPPARNASYLLGGVTPLQDGRGQVYFTAALATTNSVLEVCHMLRPAYRVRWVDLQHMVDQM
jgi:hypothetical protein